MRCTWALPVGAGPNCICKQPPAGINCQFNTAHWGRTAKLPILFDCPYGHAVWFRMLNICVGVWVSIWFVCTRRGVWKRRQRKAEKGNCLYLSLAIKSKPFKKYIFKTITRICFHCHSPVVIFSLEKCGTELFTLGLPQAHTDLGMPGLVQAVCLLG